MRRQSSDHGSRNLIPNPKNGHDYGPFEGSGGRYFHENFLLRRPLDTSDGLYWSANRIHECNHGR